MKKSRIKRKSTSSIRKIQDKIWEECRRIKYEERKDSSGCVDCYTCNSHDIVGSNRQLGHMWPKATLSARLKYELDILEWQCASCNIWHGGEGAIFYSKKLQDLGKKRMKELEKIKNEPPINAMDYYKELLIELQKK